MTANPYTAVVGSDLAPVTPIPATSTAHNSTTPASSAGANRHDILGDCDVHVLAVEFQKRGAPHCHIIILS